MVEEKKAVPVTTPSTARLPLEYGIRREEQEAYGVGQEAPPAKRRGVHAGFYAIKTFKRRSRDSHGCGACGEAASQAL
jgi:hypothetical protein